MMFYLKNQVIVLQNIKKSVFFLIFYDIINQSLSQFFNFYSKIITFLKSCNLNQLFYFTYHVQVRIDVQQKLRVSLLNSCFFQRKYFKQITLQQDSTLGFCFKYLFTKIQCLYANLYTMPMKRMKIIRRKQIIHFEKNVVNLILGQTHLNEEIEKENRRKQEEEFQMKNRSLKRKQNKKYYERSSNVVFQENKKKNKRLEQNKKIRLEDMKIRETIKNKKIKKINQLQIYDVDRLLLGYVARVKCIIKTPEQTQKIKDRSKNIRNDNKIEVDKLILGSNHTLFCF
ncbi:unnamed protein product [Paramecium sonneborni]|uniref:Uncharacterized protein n=1 Tax=Paramecium sonneborni TaxID=65129 RepID=A0A8S1N5S2_9CILI|nr:unnamed protein product [Paramecium sonneborni]